ncbi:amidase family protein [Paenibacillus monticola]|uniref:Amidase n=1 Tax=Paenibacillus monticola TaxID=2666075 RepID=A0A7X2H309_9BACL|nr:amidase family protein [Paenibacillus monticola]MRN52440.1 amidase [Paenibacillus monticola]
MKKDLFKLNIDVEDASILELQDAMENGKITSRELFFFYLSRIAIYDQDGPYINSIMEMNPDAIFIAEALDLERQRKGSRGPLHGIPILVKDNIETGDKMRTSAGALALAQHVSTEDAFLIRRLRESGAIILGKTNMTEWANGVSSTMWAGYSSKGGQVAHPYGDFFVGGSSTGSAAAVAMSFAAAAIGTETSASILSPAIQMSIVGIKPTVGLISRSGLIPFSYSQDTAGPVARTVSDAAVLLSALVGRDEQDPATWRNESNIQDYTAFLDKEGLHGVRIGVFCEVPNYVRESGEYDEALFNQAVSALSKAGAEVVENIDIPSFHGPWKWNKMNLEFKHGVENYLQRLPAQLPIHSLSELIDWNVEHADKALKYGQDLLEFREGLTDPLKNKDYIMESIMDLYLAQNEGIDYAINRNQLDAIMFPAYIGADICARAGYPSIAIPAGYRANGRPFGITFAGKAFTEPTLIRIAYSFEQITKFRKKPVFN